MSDSSRKGSSEAQWQERASCASPDDPQKPYTHDSHQSHHNDLNRKNHHKHTPQNHDHMDPRASNDHMDHNDHHHPQIFEYRAVDRGKLLLSLTITLTVMVIEAVGGYLTNSIALISDAAHMFTHALAISLGLAAIHLAGKPACHHRTFGLFRAEVLAAFINGLFLLLLALYLISEAVMRVMEPREVEGLRMLGIALLGLFTNGASLLILRGANRRDMNIKGVFYHLLADAVSSVGIVAAALIIHGTGWNLIDPVVSIGISLLIIVWARGILKESLTILLEMAPAGMDTETISCRIREEIPEIISIYDVHVWAITPDRIALTAHLKLGDQEVVVEDQHRIIQRINDVLRAEYGITGTTIQIAPRGEPEECNLMCHGPTEDGSSVPGSGGKG